MQTQNIIERAFELARGSTNIDHIRKVLRQEGYSNVDAHLGGASIRAELKRQFKEVEAALDAKAYAKYPQLTVAETQSLVVDDKWLAAVDAAIHEQPSEPRLTSYAWTST